MLKKAFIGLADFFIFFLAGIAAYLIKFYPDIVVNRFFSLILVLGVFRIVSFIFFGLYQWHFRFSSLNEFIRLLSAVSCASFITYALAGLFGAWAIWQFMLVEGMCAVALSSSFRFFFRFKEVVLKEKKKSAIRVLIMGAGEAGESIIRSIQLNPLCNLIPVALVDDDYRKKGMHIRGVKVYGGQEKIPDLVKKLLVNQIIIAIPSASGQAIRKIISYCEKTQAQVRILPGIWEIIEGDAELSQVRDVVPEDLLGRETIKPNIEALERFFQNKVVMVTGGCGSIGREIVRQVEALPIQKLIVVDRNENETYFLKHRHSIDDLSTQLGDEDIVKTCVADVVDEKRMREIFEEYRPHIVLHAAAYKHVPLMEQSPSEAVRNNILGTKVLAQIAHDCHVERFVLISTDKAVKPQNTMGATKRIAELVIENMNEMSQTKFSAVRFGNVLGSNGSLVPIIKKQIEKGGPVTVTDKKAKRYFMTVAEAALLILNACLLAEGGEIFVLDMGEQVVIDDLVRQMIVLMGYVPEQDIQISYIGLRQGEKLEEDLYGEGNTYEKTTHPKILRVFQEHHDSGKFLAFVEAQALKMLELSRDEQLSPKFKIMLSELLNDQNDPSKVKV